MAAFHVERHRSPLATREVTKACAEKIRYALQDIPHSNRLAKLRIQDSISEGNAETRDTMSLHLRR